MRHLSLTNVAIGDAGLVALALALWRLPALERPWRLYLEGTQITNAGCAALVAALDSGALPALVLLDLDGIPASAAARDAVREALAKSRAAALP